MASLKSHHQIIETIRMVDIFLPSLQMMKYLFYSLSLREKKGHGREKKLTTNILSLPNLVPLLELN